MRGPQRADWLAKIYDRSRPEVQRKLDIVEELVRHTNDLDTSIASLSIAFTLAHPAVTSSIISPRTLEQLEDVLRGARPPIGRRAARRDRRPGAARHWSTRRIAASTGWWLEKRAARRRR